MKKLSLIILLLVAVLCGCSNAETTQAYTLKFSESELSLKVGQEEELSFSSNFMGDFSWESDNENVVTIEDGFATGVAAGVANVTISATIDGNELRDTMKITVIAKGPSTFTVTIEDKNYTLAAGKPVSALLSSLYGRTYEKKDGYAFEGWYIDPNFSVKFDITSLLDSDISLFPKYRKTTDKVGVPMTIDTILKYGKGNVTDLGNVFTVSPGYNYSLSSFDLNGYTLFEIKYDVETEQYKVISYANANTEIPYDGFLLGIKKTWEKFDSFLTRLSIGSFFDLDTYSVNTATKIYFDRQMDSGSVDEVISANLLCSFCAAYDATYKKMLYSKNGDSKAYPASTTKVITAMAALKYASLDDTYTINDDVALTYTGPDPSVAGLKVGQVWTLRQLLYAMLLPSGNDAAYAVACLTIDVMEPGNTYTAREKSDKFADLMNEVAEEAGATNSHFMVPDGNSYYKANGSWDDRLTYHYVTANDMVRIARYAFAFGEIAEVTSTSYISFKINSGETYSFSNTNGLINKSGSNYYEGAVGLKTGTTTPGGYCLVSAVEYDGRFVIVAVLKSTSGAGRYSDSKTMYNLIYGK